MRRGLALDLWRLGTTASVAGFKLDIPFVDERSQRSNVMASATALGRHMGVQIRGRTLKGWHRTGQIRHILSVVRGCRRYKKARRKESWQETAITILTKA
jgi:hypothetical protein